MPAFGRTGGIGTSAAGWWDDGTARLRDGKTTGLRDGKAAGLRDHGTAGLRIAIPRPVFHPGQPFIRSAMTIFHKLLLSSSLKNPQNRLPMIG